MPAGMGAALASVLLLTQRGGAALVLCALACVMGEPYLPRRTARGAE